MVRIVQRQFLWYAHQKIMRTLTHIIALALLGSVTAAADIKEIIGKVVGVNDGDTLTVLAASKVQYKIRLQGIDAPEKAQAFGEKSKQALSEMVFGKTVKVESRGTDRYDRTLGEVFVGTNWINRAMVEQGWAWHYIKYSKLAELSKAEQEAKQRQLGLWSDKEPVPPWEFRKQKRAK